MPRFLLVMFPMYLVLAILGRRTAVHETLLVVGMGLGCLFMALYAQWYWVCLTRQAPASRRRSVYTARDAPRARSTQRPA